MEENLKYNEFGYLENGVHSVTADEFITFFCDNGNRKDYKKAIINIFDFAKEHRATRVIIGGSFITKQSNPEDLDCLIVFPSDRYIPDFVDCAQMDNISYDILYAIEKNGRMVDTFITLMTTDDYGRNDRGVVDVRLNDFNKPWVTHFIPDDEDLNVIHRIYSYRNFVERNKRRGLLIVIHGLLTRAEWLANLVPAANHQGWMVAPFIYDNPPGLLFSNGKRDEIIEKFRDWMGGLIERYNPENISVVAHSFGTFVITKYLDLTKDTDFAPSIDTLMLTGGIINPNYDWNPIMGKTVGRLVNVTTGRDDAVWYMPNTDWKRLVGMDKLFGKCAIDGFISKVEGMNDLKMDILTHTNIFKMDFINHIMLPMLNVNNGIQNREAWIENNEKRSRKVR